MIPDHNPTFPISRLYVWLSCLKILYGTHSDISISAIFKFPQNAYLEKEVTT